MSRGKFAVYILVAALILGSTMIGVGEKGSHMEKVITVEGEKSEFIKENMKFSTPLIIEGNEYASIVVDNTSHYTQEPGTPRLPVITKTYIFPAGTKIDGVECHPVKTGVMKVNKKILPSVGAIPLSYKERKIKRRIDERVYGNESYPGKWFFYNIDVGLYNRSHVIFLTLEIYPVNYYPSQKIIEYAKQIEIKVEYKKGTMKFNDTYDLLIITPSKFVDPLQPLVAHKENHSVRTKLITTEEIYSIYKGRDEPEKIKYAIKDAIEQYGIKYVLLAGGMEGQHVNNWYIPVRYSHLDDGIDTGYMSDLYYADVYKYDNGSIVFDDWDSNGNGIYAEWNQTSKDVLDMYPDVYVGRLAFRWKWEIKPVVNKIIDYENNAYNTEWFRRMVALGGDDFSDKGFDYIEGQIMCDKALDYMDGFEHVRMYVEGGDVELTTKNAERELSKGEGFAYFSGHGSPASWGVHPHNRFYKWIDFDLKNIRKLNNGGKLPVLIVGGCLNCRFDTSILRIFTDGIWTYFLDYATPECWGWLFTRKPDGGSIATMGYTDVGYGAIGDGDANDVPDNEPDDIPDCIQYFDGWLEPHFFEVYNKQGKDILGEVWGTNIADYLNQFPIDWNIEWKNGLPDNFHIVNCKIMQEWVLFGDPSLKIGGFPTDSERY